ncbi:hypothetical protein QR680_000143 [Steinernema hermaphroditum]|uniref:G-protein coupled receptors family 1 profile domain-containing protein n=1 Tax=Steinernema hermaphroditum TaxID=289476 RepID=A0AA39LDS6_9BILA|nr:hypothetical protein QR680_000143 [Steinernema hermaphroditum]
MNCFSVQEDSFDYEQFDWENFTAGSCNCSVKLHTYLAVCADKCEPPRTELPPFEEIFLPALLYLMVFLIGTVGNALVIFVVNRFKRMRNVTNVFLASLSTADLCLIWFCVPIMFVKYMSYAWFMGRFACYSVHYIQAFTCFCSVLTMTMISFERYVAIAYPMRNMWLSSIGRAKKAISCIWMASAFLALPSALRIDYKSNETLLGQKVYWCSVQFADSLFGFTPDQLDKIFALYQVLLLIVFPVVTMTVCYTRISLIVYSSSKNKSLSSAMIALSRAATNAVSYANYATINVSNVTIATHNDQLIKRPQRVAESNKKQIVQMLISIVVMYTICWTPTIADELLTSFGYICRTSNTAFLKYMRMGFRALAYCQSCINPICYAFISQNFRNTFKMAYSKMRQRLQDESDFRSRCHSGSSVLSSRHYAVRQSSRRSVNTLNVPRRSVLITPNMSRDISQLSLVRPGTPGSIILNRKQSIDKDFTFEAQLQFLRVAAVVAPQHIPMIMNSVMLLLSLVIALNSVAAVSHSGFDLTKLPHHLNPIAFLVGIWRSEHGGKAIFPTIPKFTYGEEIQFSLSDDHMSANKALNYTAFAWGINDKDELHSEYGYITVQPGTHNVAMTTVMNNGFVTVEEGPVHNGHIRFKLQDIGRISFSRDLPVHNLIREWTLLDSVTLQARLDMETLTHGMQEHTFIRYTKIFP